MQEFSVKEYKPIQSFNKGDVLLGSKSLVLFQGSSFESDEQMKRSKSLLLDFFSGPRPNQVMLQGLEQVLVCSAIEGATTQAASSRPAIGVKRFRMKMTKSGSKLPHVELEEIGPSFKLELDRTKDLIAKGGSSPLRFRKRSKSRKLRTSPKTTWASGRRRSIQESKILIKSIQCITERP